MSALESSYDATVVGAGPNGLVAAITLAQAGRKVLLVEGQDVVGGGLRSEALTETGFVHDLCSAIHPMGIASPAISALGLEAHGLDWVHPAAPAAHPFDALPAAILERDLARCCEGLDDDGPRWRSLFGPFVGRFDALIDETFGPLGLPGRPVLLARFGLRALRSVDGLARSALRTERARALFAGVGAHSILPLEQLGSAAIGMMLTLAGHASGWPLPRGGAQRLADALAAHFVAEGGTVRTGHRVETLEELPTRGPVLLDVGPPGLVRMAKGVLPRGYVDRLARYRYAPGAFKIDWALDGPIPWRDAACARAATVHLAGTLEEMVHSERAPFVGEVAERPYVLLAQPSLFDDTRAPPGKHTAWAYCHVPNGWDGDATGRIEKQIERFAPGFGDVVRARHVTTPADLERRNPNLVGGDVNGGLANLGQVFARPTLGRAYRTPLRRVLLCSASTPPGGGVHGMCGYHAARAALADRALWS